MNKSVLTINIESPCSENWNAMEINARGRFCEKCSTVVVDFTTMNDEEILAYWNLKANGNQKLCGRFKANQLNRQIVEKPEFKDIRVESNSYYKLQNSWQKFLWMLLVSMGLFVLESCNDSKLSGKVEKHAVQHMQRDSSSTIQKNEPVELMGDTVIVDKPENLQKPKPCIIKRTKMGKVKITKPQEIQEIELMGDVMGGIPIQDKEITRIPEVNPPVKK